MLLYVLATACSSVDVVPLTEHSFPSKASIRDIEVLEHEPACPHILLADLAAQGKADDFQHLQTSLLDKAASLGADAVIFAKAQPHTRHHTDYQSYPAWSFGGWMYGSYPYGYGYYGGWPVSAGDVAVSHEVTELSVRGTAIRFQAPSGKC